MHTVHLFFEDLYQKECVCGAGFTASRRRPLNLCLPCFTEKERVKEAFIQGVMNGNVRLTLFHALAHWDEGELRTLAQSEILKRQFEHEERNK